MHKELGRFCREKQYSDRFEQLLIENKFDYKREFEVSNLQNESPDGNRVDFLIEGKIIIDFKTKNYITKEDYYQMQRYLRGANLELGMIVNFRQSHLKPKRVLNSEFHS
jgi:GxxExxY protein